MATFEICLLRLSPMEQLDRLSSYFNERERKRLQAKAREESNGLPEMSEAEIRLSCLENHGYESPELNDKLYLHFRGYQRIANLSRYTSCKSLWLDSNGFQQIEGLEALTELRCLYLSKNLLTQIEGLDSLQQLVILDLSCNRLTQLSGLACCTALQTLNVSSNHLTDISHLRDCASISTLDLSNNRLASEDTLEVLAAMPALVTLSMNGNEVAKTTAHFRKKMIAAASAAVAGKQLGYLDRPVDERERICAIAFMEGGASAEESARTAYNASIEAKRIAEAQQFKIWQTEQAALRATARAEGRSLIREFTPEEVEQRRQEAEAAAAEERKMLWQLQGGGGEQPQEMVEQRVLEEEENVLPMPPLSAEVVQEVRTPSGVAASEVVTPSVVQEAAPLALLPPCPPPPPTPEELAQAEATATALAAASLAAQTLARDQAAQADADAQQANERAQRVADSMAMYLQQLKQRPEPSASCTWDGQLKQGEEETKGQHKAKGVYWTEEMDLLLAKYVGTCAYDFQDIANRMQAAAKASTLGNPSIHSSPEQLSETICRTRWSHLDASNWSTPAPGVTAKDTLFRVHVTDDMLLTSAKNLSYDQLKAKSAGQMPNYLQVPKVFPSTSEYDELD